jgi:SAM-dependent methyltransferase
VIVIKNIDFGFVADIYDDYVNVDFDIPFYKTLCKRYGGTILELMCGTGRVSLPLIEEGINLTCVDYSREMLDVFAKKLNGKNTALFCQDVCELDISEKFDFIFIPFNSFSEITDSQKRKQAVSRIIEHLADNGDLLITLYNPEYRVKSADGNMKCLGKYDIANEQTLIVTYYNSLDSTANRIYGTQFYEIYDSHNKLVDKRFLNISFSLVASDEIKRLCKEFGLAIKEIYGDYNFGAFYENSQFMNFLLTRQA